MFIFVLLLFVGLIKGKSVDRITKNVINKGICEFFVGIDTETGLVHPEAIYKKYFTNLTWGLPDPELTDCSNQYWPDVQSIFNSNSFIKELFERENVKCGIVNIDSPYKFFNHSSLTPLEEITLNGYEVDGHKKIWEIIADHYNIVLELKFVGVPWSDSNFANNIIDHLNSDAKPYDFICSCMTGKASATWESYLQTFYRRELVSFSIPYRTYEYYLGVNTIKYSNVGGLNINSVNDFLNYDASSNSGRKVSICTTEPSDAFTWLQENTNSANVNIVSVGSDRINSLVNMSIGCEFVMDFGESLASGKISYNEIDIIGNDPLLKIKANTMNIGMRFANDIPDDVYPKDFKNGYSWGSNSNGVLLRDNPDFDSQRQKHPIDLSLSGYDVNRTIIKLFDASFQNSIAILRDTISGNESIVVAGSNYLLTTPSTTFVKIDVSVLGENQTEFLKVECHSYDTCIVLVKDRGTGEKKIYGLGTNKEYIFSGDATTYIFKDSLVDIHGYVHSTDYGFTSVSNVKDFALSGRPTYFCLVVVTEDNDVWYKGHSHSYPGGSTNPGDDWMPVSSGVLNKTDYFGGIYTIRGARAGFSSGFYLLTHQDEVIYWGDTSEAGIFSGSNQRPPVFLKFGENSIPSGEFSGLEGKVILDIQTRYSGGSGTGTTYALTTDGELYSWDGTSSASQNYLGRDYNTTEERKIAFPVNTSGIDGRIIDISASRYSFFIQTDTGKVYALGLNQETTYFCVTFPQIGQNQCPTVGSNDLIFPTLIHQCSNGTTCFVPKRLYGYVGFIFEYERKPQSCPGNLDPNSNCVGCLGNWEDNNDNCTTCPQKFDQNNCVSCNIYEHFEGNNCENCSANYGPFPNCNTCPPQFDPPTCSICVSPNINDNNGLCDSCKANFGPAWPDCDTCPQNFEQNDCQDCNEKYMDGGDGGTCTECKEEGFDPKEGCEKCVKGYTKKGETCVKGDNGAALTNLIIIISVLFVCVIPILIGIAVGVWIFIKVKQNPKVNTEEVKLTEQKKSRSTKSIHEL